MNNDLDRSIFDRLLSDYFSIDKKKRSKTRSKTLIYSGEQIEKISESDKPFDFSNYYDKKKRSEIFHILDKHFIHSDRQIGKISESDKPFVIPTFLWILSVSNISSSMERESNIQFSHFVPTHDISSYVKVNDNGEKWFYPTTEVPMVVAGWFGKLPTPNKSSRLALVYSLKCIHHRRGDIVSMEKPLTILYKDKNLELDFVKRVFSEQRKETKENFKKSSQEWRGSEKIRWFQIKKCENCGREFIAYRNDARSCSLSACKKALSRKRKIRTYKKN